MYIKKKSNLQPVYEFLPPVSASSFIKITLLTSKQGEWYRPCGEIISVNCFFHDEDLTLNKLKLELSTLTSSFIEQNVSFTKSDSSFSATISKFIAVCG